MTSSVVFGVRGLYSFGGFVPYLCQTALDQQCAIGSLTAIFGNGSIISGNRASAPQGVALANYGSMYLGRGARSFANVGASEASNNANLT